MKKTAPFTDKEVKELNHHQNNDLVHSYTCCGYDGCKRSEQKDDSKLIITKEGMVCPCGKYTQDWAH